MQPIDPIRQRRKTLEVARVIVDWCRQVMAIMTDRSLPYPARKIMVWYACFMARVSVRRVLAQACCPAEYPHGGVVEPTGGERVLTREEVEGLLGGDSDGTRTEGCE